MVTVIIHQHNLHWVYNYVAACGTLQSCYWSAGKKILDKAHLGMGFWNDIIMASTNEWNANISKHTGHKLQNNMFTRSRQGIAGYTGH